MNLLETCKSGFYHKIATEFNESSVTYDEDIMMKISSLILFPGAPGHGISTILKIKIPFLEAYKILGDIIRYAYTVPTLDYVQFLNISKPDLYNLCTTVLKSFQVIPFKVEEICYYPKNHCFDVYIKMNDAEYINKYVVRDNWNKKFKLLFKTERCNIVMREKK